jgi:hypothetical protein
LYFETDSFADSSADSSASPRWPTNCKW